jgi:hypothetical protein
VIVGGETGGRWLGGFDRSLRAVALSPFVSQTLGMLTSSENSDDLKVVRDLVESGKVTPAIDRTYSLSETPAAIRYVHEGQARGKVVIIVRRARRTEITRSRRGRGAPLRAFRPLALHAACFTVEVLTILSRRRRSSKAR